MERYKNYGGKLSHSFKDPTFNGKPVSELNQVEKRQYRRHLQKEIKKSMNRRETRNRQKHLNQVNKHYSDTFVPIMRSEWPEEMQKAERLLQVFRNKNFLVQIFKEKASIRLSVSRTMLKTKGQWSDNISWDELYMIKNAIGYRDCMFVEIYPREADLVNVANMRHLWMIEHEGTNIGWKR